MGFVLCFLLVCAAHSDIILLKPPAVTQTGNLSYFIVGQVAYSSRRVVELMISFLHVFLLQEKLVTCL